MAPLFDKVWDAIAMRLVRSARIKLLAPETGAESVRAGGQRLVRWLAVAALLLSLGQAEPVLRTMVLLMGSLQCSFRCSSDLLKRRVARAQLSLNSKRTVWMVAWLRG